MQSQWGIRRRDDNPYRFSDGVGFEPQSLATAKCGGFLLFSAGPNCSQTVLNLLLGGLLHAHGQLDPIMKHNQQL